MMIKKISLCLYGFLFCSSVSVFSEAALPSITPDSWTFYVAPYLWAINMNGTVQVADQPFSVHETFSDLFKHLNFGGMLWLSAEKGRFGAFLDSVYAVTSASKTIDQLITLNARNQFGIFEGAFSYKIIDRQLSNTYSNATVDQFSIAPYLGSRYTLNNSQLNATNIHLTDNQQWNDPMLGIRLDYNLHGRWDFNLAGDIGGINSHYSYNVLGLIGYKPYKHLAFYLGYRDLYQNYHSGTGINYFSWKMSLFGPIAGLSFSF